jgi:hypothetical protein
MVRTNAAARANHGDGSIVRQGGPVKIEASGRDGAENGLQMSGQGLADPKRWTAPEPCHFWGAPWR